MDDGVGNPYAYCANHPVYYIDSSGNEKDRSGQKSIDSKRSYAIFMYLIEQVKERESVEL